MYCKFEEGKDLIINEVIAKIQQSMPKEEAAMIASFVFQFYGLVALEDLQAWTVEDLYAAAIHYWSFIKHRPTNKTKIHVYNPDFERHGWQTTHTVIEIITDDMPFLIDSLRLAIHRLGLVSHLIMHMGGFCVKRDKEGTLCAVLPKNSDKEEGALVEAPIIIEINRQTCPKKLEELIISLEEVMHDNRVVVEDWKAMRQKVREAITSLDNARKVVDAIEVEEASAFLHWMEDHHFTFLGVRDYELVEKDNVTLLQALPETGLGVLRPECSTSSILNISTMSPEARTLSLTSHSLVLLNKANTFATVHRGARTDYIGVKRFNKQGKVIGERRIIGLYTSAAYNTNPQHIPYLRRKVASVIQNSHLSPRSHAGKILLNILETFPRDEVIQASEQELLEIAMGIFYMQIQERRKIRMFARKDPYCRFISCLVYVPRDRFNTELRREMQWILKESFQSQEVTFSTWFSESILARIHFIVRTDPKVPQEWDYTEIERKLIEAGRSWFDDLQQYLLETFGEEEGNRLYARYHTAFPGGYCDSFLPKVAVYDIKHMEEINHQNPLVMSFYKSLDEIDSRFRLKVYQYDNPIPLSDVLPILEHLGLRAISERTYTLKFEDGGVLWINDLMLQYTDGEYFDIDALKDVFRNAFLSVWFGKVENDGFNRLVLSTGLEWRQVVVLRAYSKYFKQIGLTFSQEYIEAALYKNASIAKMLFELFDIRFHPQENAERQQAIEAKEQAILEALDQVDNLDEDKIIRQYMHVIAATIRTNYYQLTKEGQYKPTIAIKLHSKGVPGIPKPYPLYEVFVYAPRVEGIHLRGGKVARGGIRWSDRKEDFRTEILGLMKAQQVKNAVIVPYGAKGGFVPKQLPQNGSREEINTEGVKCYQDFISGLLDVTDNLVEGKVVTPPAVQIYDEDGPYLVVAADKGTASFSDYANAISHEYHHWLGDAFASGGSLGYDHKKMGITARGAWESVKRHFYNMNIDIRNTDFTVVGIGDMAGDVFGNGMLLSKHIKLIAAFNNVHIFVDPDPNLEKSYAERERLFHLPRSTWADYDAKLISKGGGVFRRDAKRIKVSKEMKQFFEIKQNEIEPNELIRIILKARIDLLWSAGIGTFVKASAETHTDVGDRTNDAIRINATQLRCKVVGEGGNLGFTQLARVEYAFAGGHIYTDFIDNSAAVHCSDKEVNIKILLDSIVADGDLTQKQRNTLLSEMTDEIATQVLRENFSQIRSIDLTAVQALSAFELHLRYINELERKGKIDRALEFLPDDKALLERKMLGKGLGKPGISILQSYSKTLLKEEILASNVPEEAYFNAILTSYFPTPLQERFKKQMQEHPLRREIIATKLSNIIVNEMGFSFVFRMQEETGAPVSAIVRAYIIARKVLNIESIWKQIEGLEGIISASKEKEFMLFYVRLLRRVTRWFLRHQRTRLHVAKSVKLFEPGIKELKKALPGILGKEYRQSYDAYCEQYVYQGISENLANELTVSRGLFSAFDIIKLALDLKVGVTPVAELYFGIGAFLDIGWIRNQIIAHPTENNWESLSREALRDDLDLQQRQLTAGIIGLSKEKTNFIENLTVWSESHKNLIKRWEHILTELRSSTALNYTMYFVAIRELLDLTQTTQQMTATETMV